MIRDAIARGATQSDAAALAGITYARLRSRMIDQLADVRVGRGTGGGRRPSRGGDPTPAEIALAAAMLRRRWTPDRWGLHEPPGPAAAGRDGRPR